jgi:predicted alpha/beta-fold hydrolase
MAASDTELQLSTSVDVRPRFSHASLDHLLEVSGAKVPLTSPQLYSSCHTDDLRQALLYISHHYPRAPLLGLGFSLGANVLTRYVAEEGEECRLVSACALACVSLSSSIMLVP